jgi:RimJ/RimL family protein N-acetyltransferase
MSNEDVTIPSSAADASRIPYPASPILNITGERVGLGPIEREHLPFIQRWDNDLFVLRTAGIGVRPRTVEDVAAWYERGVADHSRARFVIVELASGQPIGTCELRDIDYRHRTAEIGITIGEGSARGQGYGTEATRLLLDYAFTALGLHNVLLDVAEYSLAGRRAYEKAGFREIGRRRECNPLGGRLYDDILMEALATDFDSPVLGKVFVPDAPR